MKMNIIVGSLDIDQAVQYLSFNLAQRQKNDFGNTLTRKALTMDIRSRIDSHRMGAYQWTIIAIALFINSLDGYDMVAMAFAASAVTDDFGLSGSALGWLLAAAGIGIALGSLILAPRADRWGRRTVILLGLAIDLVGLVATALAPNFALLLAARILTGVGVGAILTCVTVLVSEFSNLRHRGLAVAIYASGYGLGAAACGWVAKSFGAWEIIFWVGAALTLVALALAWSIPESPDFLAARGDSAGVRRLALRLGLGSDIIVAPAQPSDASLRDVLSPAWRPISLRLWVAFALGSSAFGFASQWTPKLLDTAGLSAEQGILGGIMLSVGGTLGSLAFGTLTTRIRAQRLLIGCCLAAAVVLVAFISLSGTPLAMLVLGVVAGMFLNGCITGFYTVVPAAYPGALRASAMGAAIGVVRVATTASPILVGYLVDAGWTPFALYVLFAVLTVAGGVCLRGIREYRKVHTTPARERVLV